MQELIAWAHATGTAVVARGAGSGLAGAAVGLDGAVILDLSGLDRILDLDPDEQLARVQPGVITADLDAAASAHGLMYAPDPGSVGISTIGGNIATNAGGLRGAKYGVTRDHVLALDVVLADGTLVRVGRDTIKGVTGYDLVGLFTGSEGTLGIIVGATVRLIPRPVRTATAAAFFADVSTAARAVTAITRSGARPAVLELVDGPTLGAIDLLEGTDLRSRGEAFLLIQTDGFGAEEELAVIVDAISGLVTQVETATDAAASDRLLFARRRALPALEALGQAAHRGHRRAALATRRSRRADRRDRRRGGRAHLRVRARGRRQPAPDHRDRAGRRMPSSRPPRSPRPTGSSRWRSSWAAPSRRSTASGRLKREWARRELGADVHGLQLRLRALFDPQGILNPGSSL